jgi:ABC transport system ATP-binding/permease protein
MIKPAPVVLTALDIEVHFGEQVILDKASLTIHEGDKIGLVGRNGTGKSTFLKIIAGLFHPDAGEVAYSRGVSIGYLSQEFSLDQTKNVEENILAGASQIISLIDEFNHLPYDHPKREALEIEINKKDAWNLGKRMELLIKNTGAPEKERDITSLSGGEKRRVALCRTLIANPDLLILDEPTNHLDISFIEWLEGFLSSYKGTIIFVTHDRYFLDYIANRIIELSSATFYSHPGNYTSFLINKSERMAIAEKEEEKRQNFLRRELKWVMTGPKARRTKSKSRLDKFDEIASKDTIEEEPDVELIIPPAERLGNKVLELKNVAISIEGKELLRNLNFIFQRGRKLGIVGNNGAGKTTLLKVIMGLTEPDIGKVETGDKTMFNYVDQSRLLLNEEDSVVKALGEGNEVILFGKQKIPVWTYLRRFLFTDDRINTKVGKLSGGEKSRLTLAKILMNGGNFLILDEPTNDLDLSTLRMLEEALIQFKECVVIVSHDRYFLNRVCNGILAFEGNGTVYFSEGDYDYYIEKKNSRLGTGIQKEEKVKKEDTRVKSKVRKLTYKEEKELEGIEEEIFNSEERIKEIEIIFSSPDFYDKYSDDLINLTAELEELKKKMNGLYHRWEELENIKSGDN